jgi:SNF2 family DNA or RNA helicase
VSDVELQATGHVLSVMPRPDGTFGVLIGPAPKMFWYATTEPPKLGTSVTLSGQIDEQIDMLWGQTRNVLTKLKAVTVQFTAPTYATRYVSPEWVARVDGVMRRPLYRYQSEGAAWLAMRIASGQGSILADDPGLGKSAQAVAALCATRMFPTLLVCPTTLKYNWLREFSWANEPPSVFVVNGTKGDLPEAQVYIANYDILRAREDQFYALSARTMVLDEAQAVKEARPKMGHRAAIATKLGLWIVRTIELTGTPIMNRPKDLWRLLHIADPAEWPNYQDFEDHFCKQQPDDGPQEGKRIVTSYGRVEHLDELQTLVQPVLLRRLKSEVLPDLPPKSRRSILVSMDEIDAARYQRAKRDVVSWLHSIGGADVARRAMQAEAFARLTVLRKLAAIGKMRGAVPEYLDQWFGPPGEPRPDPLPLVIFAYHRDIILGNDDPDINIVGLYRECAERRGLRVSIIGGRDKPEDRQAAVDAFQSGETDVFISPIRCGGVGINLQRAADALFIERTWTPSEMTQAEDRIHRLDSMKPCTVTYLDAVDTIDERLAEVIEAKQVLIRHVLDEEPPDGESHTVLESILDAFAA